MMTQKTAAKSLSLNEDLRQVVISGIEELFSTTFAMEVKPGNHFISADYAGHADVSGSVGMVQEKSEGILTIGFPTPLILSIMGKMYHKEFKELNKSVCDGVGEITNISYALARQGLNRLGYSFRMTVPQVVVGAQHEIHHMHHGETLVIPFHTMGEEFVVFITLQNIQD